MPEPSNPPPLPPQSTGVPAGPNKTIRNVLLGCGGLFAVFVLGGIAVTFYFVYTVSRDVEAREKAYFTAAPGTKIFINKSDAIPANLKDQFVPFAFHYPDKFAVVPDENAFIKIEKQENGKTMAGFAVLPLTISSPKAESGTIYPPLMNDMSKRFAARIPGFQEISQKPADFKSAHFYHDGWDMRWQSGAQDTSPGGGTSYGRVLFLRESTTSHGVMITMISAPSDPDHNSSTVVGDRGDLAVILQSFRLLSTSSNDASAAQQMSRTRSRR